MPVPGPCCWLARGVAMVSVVVALGCSPVPDARSEPESPLANSVWILTELGGDSVARPPSFRRIDRRFREGGRLTGFTGCNILTGSYTTTGTRLEFGDPLATTRRICPDLANSFQEQVLLDALREVNRYEFTGNRMNLYMNERLLLRLVNAPETL